MLGTLFHAESPPLELLNRTTVLAGWQILSRPLFGSNRINPPPSSLANEKRRPIIPFQLLAPRIMMMTKCRRFRALVSVTLPRFGSGVY
jgi:hypothetical protein